MDLGEEGLEGLVELLGKGRVDVAKEVAKFGAEGIKFLVPILKGEDERAKQAAIAALAEIAKNHSIKVLQGDEDETVRAAAVFALFLSGDIDSVINAFKDESILVRVAAKNALSSSNSFEELIRALESDDWRIKYGVSAALEEAGGRAVKPLLKALLEGKSQEKLIKSILSRIAQNSPESIVEILSESSELRLPAMDLLLEVKNLDFSRLLRAKDRRLREAAIVMLPTSKRNEKLLLKALEDESWFVRLVAAEKIGNLKNKNPKQLKKLLRDEEIVRDTVKEFLEE
jgi:HEAT repeat protein